MEFRQIEHFVAVVEHGGFSPAARSVRIVQSALSTSVRNLERELGAALFERTTRRVALTEAGRAFLPAARRVLAEAVTGVDAVRAVAGLSRGRVAIGAIQWLGPVDLPAELAAFHRTYPEIQISVLNAPVTELIERLRGGDLDLAYLAEDGPVPDDLASQVVYREKLMLIMPEGHRLAGRDRVSWLELADEPFVEFSEGSAVTGLLRRVSAELGLRRRIVGQVTQLGLQLGLVSSGIGVAIVQGTLATTTPGLAVAELTEPASEWQVSLVSRAPRPTNPAAVALREHLSRRA